MTVKSEEAVLAVIWMTADAQLRGRDAEGFRATPTLPSAIPQWKEQPRQEADKESSLNVWWRCWKVALHNWWLLWCRRGRTQSHWRGSHLDHAPVGIQIHRVNWGVVGWLVFCLVFYFFLFLTFSFFFLWLLFSTSFGEEVTRGSRPGRTGKGLWSRSML